MQCIDHSDMFRSIGCRFPFPPVGRWINLNQVKTKLRVRSMTRRISSFIVERLWTQSTTQLIIGT